MKKFVSVSLMLVIMMSLGLGVVHAQETGEGGTIIWGNERGSGNLGSLIDIQCSGVDCRDITNLLFPGVVGLDPETLSYEPLGGDNLVSGALATGWELSDDGTVMTVSLRDDLTWSDGTPITALDVYFTWAAINQGDQIGLSSSYGPTRRDVVNAEVIDDYTIAFEFETANCDALRRLSYSVSPAHEFGFTAEDTIESFDFTVFEGHPTANEPVSTHGPFKFTRIEPGTAVYLEADDNYVDASAGAVIPAGLAYLDVPDYTVMAERLIANQAGDVNYMHEPDTTVLETLRDGGANLFEAPGTVWHYVALNLADPDDPRYGLDEDGNPIDQGVHPILGDLRVRQALQYAVDIDEIIASAHNGNASPMVAGTIPSAYTLNPNLERRPYDLDAARALLEEAGWVSTGDSLVDGGDGLRTCVGCETAEEGTEMFLDIVAADEPRTNVAVILQASMLQLGIDTEVATLDFNTLYNDNLGAQTFDMAIAGWRGGIPFNPDQRGIFGADADIPALGTEEYGFNFGSWYNEEFQSISEAIVDPSQTNSCDPNEIIPMAHRVQEILWEEQPYLHLYALNSAYAVNDTVVEGFAPFPTQGTWNIDTWVVAQ